jgi:hypothetical protein
MFILSVVEGIVKMFLTLSGFIRVHPWQKKPLTLSASIGGFNTL